MQNCTIEHTLVPRDAMKRFLQDQIEFPFILGNNYIKILKVSDKYVEIEELFNGFKQSTKQRYQIESAYRYWKYRTTQIKEWPKNELYNDLSEQTLQYRTQLDNIEELQLELINHLDIAIKQALIPLELSHTINFNKEDITINIETGAYYIIKSVADEMDVMKTVVEWGPSREFIPDIRGAKEVAVVNALCTLLYSKDHISFDFVSVYERYNICRNNLKKLWKEPTKQIDPILLEDLHNFIVNAPVEHTYGYKLQPVGQYERRMEVTKVSRIRTIIQIITEHEEDKFIELEDKIIKVGHNIIGNSQKIGQITEAHNY